MLAERRGSQTTWLPPLPLPAAVPAGYGPCAESPASDLLWRLAAGDCLMGFQLGLMGFNSAARSSGPVCEAAAWLTITDSRLYHRADVRVTCVVVSPVQLSTQPGQLLRRQAAHRPGRGPWRPAPQRLPPASTAATDRPASCSPAADALSAPAAYPARTSQRPQPPPSPAATSAPTPPRSAPGGAATSPNGSAEGDLGGFAAADHLRTELAADALANAIAARDPAAGVHSDGGCPVHFRRVRRPRGELPGHVAGRP